jgi:23S rRNA (adenine2030-N6)-methyltransferase
VRGRAASAKHAALPDSRYRPDGAPDYGHRFHAGNVGDVWKHCALVALAERATGRVAYVESHAGEGRYPLGATGEWTEGIGRLWSEPALGGAAGRYVACCRALAGSSERPRTYPGSPAIARAVLGPDAELALWERDPDACARLRQSIGLGVLPEAVATAERDADTVLVLVDPPYTQKADWLAVPDAFARAARAAARAWLVLWYPVKSLTRPNAMIARLVAAGVAGTIAELVTTPLDQQRSRLNGSGLVLVRPPDGVVAALAAAAPVLGPRCATHGGFWSLRVQSWSAP